jgi:hypothetical protein
MPSESDSRLGAKQHDDGLIATESVCVDSYVRNVYAVVTGNMTVTLPPPSTAKGQTISVAVLSRGDAGALTVAGGGSVAYSNDALDAANDSVVMFSNGLRWFDLLDGSGIA